MDATTTAPATVNSSTTVHLAAIYTDGHKAISCGAIRYRNTFAATITIQPEGTEVTCAKCLKATPAAKPSTPVADPAAYLPGETPMQRKRRLGLIAN